MKMAELPSSCILHYSDGINGKTAMFPIVSVRNVYIFPGIPSLLEKGFNIIRGIFDQSTSHKKFAMKELHLKADEWSITDRLNQTVDKFRDKVTFGSYPDLVNPYFKVRIRIESCDEAAVGQAYLHLASLLPRDLIVDLENSSVKDCENYVYGILQNETLGVKFKQKVESALSVIEKCLENFEAEQVCVSFNGGKDCTVLLHLFMAALQRRYKSKTKRISTLYVSDANSFPEIEKFLDETVDRYGLRLLRYTGDIKEALCSLRNDDDKIKAVLMGTRSSDPYSSELKSFLKTDSNWPEFMRVNPMLHWSYSDIWTFLHTLHLPYCVLYDRGYTSIGNLDNTQPNPALKVIDGKGRVSYRPAFTLEDCSTERLGRT